MGADSLPHEMPVDAVRFLERGDRGLALGPPWSRAGHLDADTEMETEG